MALKKTKIQWASTTWNPVIGCRKVSAGCDHCYAIRGSARMQENDRAPDYYHAGLTTTVNGRANWTGLVKTLPHKLVDPLGHSASQIVFVNSMSDLFHEDVSSEFISAVFAVMALCPQHLFLILTKRPERMRGEVKTLQETPRDILLDQLFTLAVDPSGLIERRMLALVQDGPRAHLPLPLPNVWLGVSAEDAARARDRIPVLQDTPCAKRFVSAEPLLGDVLMHTYLQPPGGVDWVIAGGESGNGARPMHPSWPERLYHECRAAGVPFWFKQWGEYCPKSQAGVVRMGNTVLVHRDGRAVPWTGFGADDRAMVDQGYDAIMVLLGKHASGNTMAGGRVVEEMPEWTPGAFRMAGKMVSAR